MIAAVLLGAAVAAAPPPPGKPFDRFPKAAASYLVAVDGRTVWERAADRPRPPASLTKLMTALVMVGRGWDPVAPVVVSARAGAASGSRAGLRAGERLAAGDLLTAMLVSSANDACLALAEHVGGSESAFVDRMNARAREMGLGATHFANACGHDASGHRSSARDLSVIAGAAMARPEIARVVRLREATFQTAKGRRITVKTGNHLLGRSDGVYGVKSGFTAQAGKCLIVAAERNGRKLLIVLLNSADRWWTADALVEAAYE